MVSKIEAFFETRFEAFLKPPGRLLASILGAFWAPFGRPGRVMLFSTKIAARYSESTIFWVSRGPKRDQNGGQNGFQRQPGSKSVLEGAQARFWHDVDFILASIFDPKIVLKKHRKSMKHGFDFRTLEGVSSTSGRSGPAECARCVKRSRLGAVAWQGLA